MLVIFVVQKSEREWVAVVVQGRPYALRCLRMRRGSDFLGTMGFDGRSSRKARGDNYRWLA